LLMARVMALLEKYTRPWIRVDMPSVLINELILPLVTSSPLIIPTTSPAAAAASIPSKKLSVACTTMMAMLPARFMMATVDRSRWPQISTMVNPITTMPLSIVVPRITPML